MYTSQLTKERIRTLCKTKKIGMEQMLTELSLGVNAVRQINDTKGMASFSLAKIADYLDCSVDYLLGRTDNPEISTNNHNITPNMSHANFGTVGGNVGGNVSNALGENITINAAEPTTSNISNEYECIIMLLNSLDKKERRHAIVDIQCMLEEDYEVKKNNK